MTYRHAVKDADNNVPFGETLPVHYNALAGLTVEETESLQDYDAFPVVGSGVFEGVEGTGGIFCDIGGRMSLARLLVMSWETKEQ